MASPYAAVPRATIHTTFSSSIEAYEFDKRVRGMIHAFLRLKVKQKAAKSQERIACVLMARVYHLEDIEEHDAEDFLCVLCLF